MFACVCLCVCVCDEVYNRGSDDDGDDEDYNRVCVCEEVYNRVSDDDGDDEDYNRVCVCVCVCVCDEDYNRVRVHSNNKHLLTHLFSPRYSNFTRTSFCTNTRKHVMD